MAKAHKKITKAEAKYKNKRSFEILINTII